MSTATSMSAIHVAHEEPHVSGMMRRINAMLERGIKALERRTQMEQEARQALRQMQREQSMQEEAKAASLPKWRRKANANHAAATREIIERINAGEITFAQSARQGFPRYRVLQFAAEHGIKIKRPGRGSHAGGKVCDTIKRMIDSGANNDAIQKETGAVIGYIQQVRRDYVGKSEDMRKPSMYKAISAEIEAGGQTPEEISAKLGCTRDYVIQVARETRRKNMLAPKPESMKSRIIAMLESGASNAEIVRIVGCRRQRIAEVRSEAGIREDGRPPRVIGGRK